MEEEKSKGELLIEFKSVVKKHIVNRKELSYINNFWDKLYN